MGKDEDAKSRKRFFFPVVPCLLAEVVHIPSVCITDVLSIHMAY